MTLPSGVSSCLIKGRFIRAVIDGPDAGDEPDGIPLVGLVVTLRAMAGKTRLSHAQAFNASPPTVIFFDDIVAETDSNGVLRHNGVEGFRVVATDDVDVRPNGFTYEVTIESDHLPQAVRFNIPAPAGGVVDLAQVFPVPATPGKDVLEWMLVREDVQAEVETIQGIRQSIVDLNARTIVDQEVIGNDLWYKRSDGTTDNAGSVRGQDGANVLPTRTAVENATAAFVVPEPVSTGALNHVHLQAAIDEAKARGIKRVRIPPPSAAAPDQPWRIGQSVKLYKGTHYDMVGVDTEHTPTQPNQPAFYIAPGEDDVIFRHGRIYVPGTRPIASAYPAGTTYGAPSRAAYSGVLSYGQRAIISGKYSGYRNGVRFGDWSGVGTGTATSLRDANWVDIEVDNVDFGLVYFGQQNMIANVRGSYVTTIGSDEPAHLVYGTWSANVSQNCLINSEAWDSEGGASVIIKGNAGVRSERISARNCSSVLVIGSGRGDHTFGDIIGTEITGVYTKSDGTLFYPEAIRSEFTLEDTGNLYDLGKRTARRIILHLKDGIPTGNLRAMSLRNRWSYGEASVSYATDDFSSGVTLVHVYGDDSNLGPLQIVNRGTGGVRGLRYTTGTRHALTAAPVMVGVSSGVTIDAGVGGTFTVDETLITSARTTDRALVGGTGAGCVVRGVRQQRRINRWYAVPLAAAPSTATPTLGNLHAIPLRLEALTSISDLAVTVTTAAAGGLVRLGIYGDDAGQPGALLRDGGTVSAATTGDKTATFTPVVLAPGDYWLCYAVQGAGGVGISGASGMSIDQPAQTPGGAISGQTVAVTGVTGNLPATFGTLVSSSTTSARVAYRVPAPA